MHNLIKMPNWISKQLFGLLDLPHNSFQMHDESQQVQILPVKWGSSWSSLIIPISWKHLSETFIKNKQMKKGSRVFLRSTLEKKKWIGTLL